MITSSKISIDEFSQIVSDIKNRGNSDLEKAMDFLNDDFEETKEMILNLTKHLDKIEELYNKILKEHESRINGKNI